MADIKQITIGSTPYNIEPVTNYLPLAGGTLSGILKLKENAQALEFRPDLVQYTTGTFYGTSGNEALTFFANGYKEYYGYGATSIQFICGEIPSSQSSWQSITPGLQIKNNKVLINKQVGDNPELNYNLEVSGSFYSKEQIRTDSPLFAYGSHAVNYPNRAAIIFEKPSSHATGIGARNENDTIYFGACIQATGEWVADYKQKWNFNGTIYENGTSLTDKYSRKTNWEFDETNMILSITN